MIKHPWIWQSIRLRITLNVSWKRHIADQHPKRSIMIFSNRLHISGKGSIKEEGGL